MTHIAPATPCLAKVPLDADRQAFALLIVHADRAIAPEPGLRQVVEFEYTSQGGFISAAQACHGGWGYIDGQGQWVLAPTLDNARGFTEDGLARFCRGGRWGYINLLAQEVIAPQFEEARPMRNGLAAVKTGPDAWRIIDFQGRFTCSATFALLDSFGAVGLALAQQWDPARNQRLWGYVDHRGQWMIAPRFVHARTFDEEAVAAVSVDGQAWGLINAQGQWVLQPCYPRIDAFNSDGLAYCAESPTSEGHGGYLNTRGKVAVKGGRHLSPRMVCGMVADSRDGTRFLDLHGAPLRGPALSYATDFQAELECAVARLAATAAPATAGAGCWGLLHTTGRFVPAPAGLLEPCTQRDGWIPTTQPDTALAMFLTTDGQVAWMDKEGKVVWRARYERGQAVFSNAQGRVLWRSPEGDHATCPRPFFQASADQYLEHLADMDGALTLALDLAEEAESRLHRWAQGQDPCEGQGHGADSWAALDPHHAGGHGTVSLRRLMHARLGKEHAGVYGFMGDALREKQTHIRLELLQRLQAQWGPADPDPEHAAPWQCRGTPMAAWRRPLRTPLAPSPSSGEWVNLPEANGLWVSLYPREGTGEGGAWWELWMMAAPSVDAQLAAQRARDALEAQASTPVLDAQGVGTAAPPEVCTSASAGPAPEAAHPTTRAGWLGVVLQNPSVIGTVPGPWLDDAMVDAALQASPAALAEVPPHLQTPARLEALLRRGVDAAVQIPPQCMTRDALLLARELYAGDPAWDALDESCSQTPAEADALSLKAEPGSDPCGRPVPAVWGCLLTPAQTTRAVQAGMRLCDVPHWLRTQALEDVALDADICNIACVASDKITPGLAQRAVQHGHGRLIRHVPAALLTPALCLASARANGVTLQDIPPPLRTLEVCVAALEDRPELFRLVPRELALQVTTELIDTDLARAREQGMPRQGSTWHVQRAWAQLWANRPDAAVADALHSLPQLHLPQHGHYILARAYQALGKTPQAALEACTVLSLQSPYVPPWEPHEDTAWLTALARWHMDKADEATLIQQLQRHPRTLADIPRARITAAMADAAMAADEATVCFVPKRLMTPARYAAALRQGVKGLEEVPPAMLSEEAWLAVVGERGWPLHRVPPAWRSLAVCAQAVQHNPADLGDVPLALRKAVGAAGTPVRAGVGPAAPIGQTASWAVRGMVGPGVPVRSRTPWLQRLAAQAQALKARLGLRTAARTADRGGWLNQHPWTASTVHALLSLLAVALHAAVSVAAWLAEGPQAGLATLVLVGLADAYWAWRFAWEGAAPGWSLAAGSVVVYLLGWCPLYRRAGRAAGRIRQARS